MKKRTVWSAFTVWQVMVLVQDSYLCPQPDLSKDSVR